MLRISKAQFKVLFADSIYNASIDNGISYVSALCYYFIDRIEPVTPAVEQFRNAHVKVTRFPGPCNLLGFSNHVLALRLPVKCDVVNRGSLFSCLRGVQAVLDTYPMLGMCGVFVKGHLVHLDRLSGFLDQFKSYAGSEKFTVTAMLVLYYNLYFLSKINFVCLFMCTMLFLNRYYWTSVLI